MWASMLGVDPLPRRASARGELACVVACILPMALIALWLGAARHPVYGHYLGTLGRSAVDDQRLAAMIMSMGCLPAFAVPALAHVHVSARRQPQQPRQTRAQTSFEPPASNVLLSPDRQA
jgi:cytochrome c oxidase assembly factor CtaG